MVSLAQRKHCTTYSGFQFRSNNCGTWIILSHGYVRAHVVRAKLLATLVVVHILHVSED